MYKFLATAVIAVSVATPVLAQSVSEKTGVNSTLGISPSDQEPPNPEDLDRSGREAIAAAALQGLVFGLVRAAVSRAGAHGYRAVTHESPG